jgi:hypothetical protein
MTTLKLLTRKVAAQALSLLLILSSFGALTQAQVITTARISGTVSDPQGAVIPKAEVVVKNDATGGEFKTKSNDFGIFQILSVPVGVYTITVTADGFKQTVVTGVKTEAAAVASVEVKLEIGTTSEIVTVSGGAEILLRSARPSPGGR